LRRTLESIIPDLGDLEAKLSAYYSKIEQVKIEPVRVIAPENVKITVAQDVKKLTSSMPTSNKMAEVSSQGSKDGHHVDRERYCYFYFFIYIYSVF